MPYLRVQLPDSCDPRGVSDGLLMAVYQTRSIECPSLCCARASSLRYASVFYFMVYLRIFLFYPVFAGIYFCAIFVCLYFVFPLFLSFLSCSCFVFVQCSSCSFVDFPLIFSCPADHVPDWHQRIFLGMVKARSVNVKNTHTP